MIASTLYPIVPSVAFDTYWKFAYLRQRVFLDRARHGGGALAEDLTDDEILLRYKFTNAYRASDRVSQYLIRNVIYDGSYSPQDLFLRILLFKLFNKIETWKLLTEKFGPISTDNFSVSRFRKFLDGEMNNGRVLYSNAYMMASGCRDFKVTRKHHAHLLLLEKMLADSVPEKIADCATMREGYDLLLSYPMIGAFLAYQYITDINYSELTDFSESEFTVPGPGARDGIRKCFVSLGGVSESELIRLMAERQDYEFERLELPFKKLGSRPLQYIDIQNLFCETDKYCRVAHPDLMGISGRTKIKQRFKMNPESIELFYPPKWGIDTEQLHGHR